MLTLLMISGMATAASWVEAFDYPDYPATTYMAGVDGWSSGYAADEWYANEYYVASATDDNVDDDPDAKNNWFTNSAIDARDMYLSGWMTTQDNDTMGFVFNLQDEDNYFAVVAIGAQSNDGMLLCSQRQKESHR